MTDTPTPRTDKASCNSKAFDSPMGAIDFARTLERELTAAREELNAVTEQLTIAREELNMAREDQAYLHKDLTIVTEQLKETKKHLKDANRGAEINAHALRINADKLTAVTEQRDKLAEAIRKHKFCDFELWDALQSLNQPTQ